MLSENSIKRLHKDSDFKEFVAFLAEKLDGLDTVKGLSDLPNELAGEEAKIRLKASELIKDILSPIINFAPKAELSEKDIKKAKDKFGIV